MNKGVQTVLGIILFIFLAIPVIGTLNGVSEANAFNTSKVEIVQRLRESGGKVDSSVTEYVNVFNKKFTNGKLEVKKTEDNSGKGMGTIAYGDEVQVTLRGEGSGAFNFTKSAKRQKEEGVKSGKPVYKSTETILIDKRAN